MIDLHIHTKYSDGEYDEFEIFDLIKQSGVTEFAICDHNTIEGSKKVSKIIENEDGYIFHTGVELTSRINDFYGGINVHLLVRDFDYDDENIHNMIIEIEEKNLIRAKRMKNVIKELYGVDISDSEINKMIKKTNCFGKPHMYKLLSKYGNYDREEYYKKMRKLKSDDLKLDAIKVIELVYQGKGNVYLAHPFEIMDEYGYSYLDISNIVKYLKGKGIDGLEVYHSKHSKGDIENFEMIAKENNLGMSFGSDYHGPNIKPNVYIGKCIKE